MVMPVPPLVNREEPDVAVETSNKLTKETLPQYAEDQLASKATTIIPDLLDSVSQLVKKQNPKAMEMAAQMYNIIPKSSGVSIFNNIQNNNINPQSDMGTYFEAIVRRMEARDHDQTALDAEAQEVQ
jgi:hypothetical protein